MRYDTRFGGLVKACNSVGVWVILGWVLKGTISCCSLSSNSIGQSVFIDCAYTEGCRNSLKVQSVPESKSLTPTFYAPLPLHPILGLPFASRGLPL